MIPVAFFGKEIMGGKGQVRFWSPTWAQFVKRFTDNGRYYIPYIQFPNAPKIGPFNAVTAYNITKLEFRNVTYPKTFKINTSNGWNLAEGMLVSDQELKTLNVKIIKDNGTVVSQMSAPRTLTGNLFYIKNLDGEGKDNGQKFSKITTAGNYIWIMTATDTTGRTVTLEMPFTAVTSGSTQTATASSGLPQPWTVTPMAEAAYKFNKNDDSRVGPGEAYAKAEDKSNGDIVMVVGSTVNQYNNTWYELLDGNYVYSGDVNKITHTETSFSGTYAFTKNNISHKQPYEASSKVKDYVSGATVTVTAKLVNGYGNTWYKISDGGYVWSGNVTEASVAPTLQFTNVTCPTNYKIGSVNGYELSGGTLESNVELKTISSKIINASGTAVSKMENKSISGTSYSIKSLDTWSSSDNGVKFSYIKTAGNYTWILTATDNSGRSLTMEMPFTASSNATSSTNKSWSYNDIIRKVEGIDIGPNPDTAANVVTETYYDYDDNHSLNIYAYVYPVDATNSVLSWSSSNTNVLKITSTEYFGNGVAVAYCNFIGVGTASVTASATDGSGKKATANITYHIAEISLKADESQIYIGGATTVVPTIVPSVATSSNLNWSSSNTNVATVDNAGNVYGVSNGQVTITAASKLDSNIKGTCVINVMKVSPTGISLNESGMSLNVGSSIILVETVYPANATDPSVTWNSSNTSVATVDEEGKVTAVSPGTAIITVSTVDGGKTSSCVITVINNNSYNLDLNGYLDGTVTYGLNEYGTVDIYINNTLVADDVSDFFAAWPYGSTYEIKDIKAKTGYQYNGIYSGSLTGTIGAADVEVILSFSKVNSGSCGDNATWSYQNGTLTISGSGPMYDYASTNEQPWRHFFDQITSISVDSGITRIGTRAFASLYSLSSVSLPQSIQSIGESAFFGSSVSDIWIPKGVTDIERYAFNYCDNLTSINIPSTVTTIGNYVFYGSRNLANINVAVANEKYHSVDGVLFDQWGLVCFPAGKACDEYTIPDTVLWISPGAFSYSKVNSVRVPDSVGLIFYYAFSYTSNLRVTIPKTVTYIADGVFAESDNVTVYCFEDSTAHTYARDNGIAFTLVDTPLNNPDFTLPNATQIIDEEAFSGIAAKRVKLPEGVTAIRRLAFANCPNLVGIYIPEDCTSIATNAFTGCANLTIYGQAGSYAEFFAGKHGFAFQAAD